MTRTFSGPFSFAVALAIVASTIVYASTPSLWVSGGTFCPNDPSWAVEVSNADANSLVYLEEYKLNSVTSTWNFNWGGNIGYTDGSGFLRYDSTAPGLPGFYYSQVIVNGQTSNTAPYWQNGYPCD